MIRMIVSLSGTRDGQDWPPDGTTLSLPPAEEEHLIAGGMAILAGKVETATAPEPETATVDTAPRKRGRG